MEFPVEVIERISVKRGTILYSETLFPNIDHGKFFIIIGETTTQYIGYFFINSNINRYLKGKQELFLLQYPLKHNDYPFLRYDSFVGCHEVMPLDKRQVAGSLQDGGSEIKGELRNSHIADILEMVRNSKVFTTAEKESFFA